MKKKICNLFDNYLYTNVLCFACVCVCLLCVFCCKIFGWKGCQEGEMPHQLFNLYRGPTQGDKLTPFLRNRGVKQPSLTPPPPCLYTSEGSGLMGVKLEIDFKFSNNVNNNNLC